MSEIVKKYSNGEMTIIWKPALCIHSRICWQKTGSLPEVFNPAEKPWIKPDAAPTERIAEQIKRCPSGALSYEVNTEQPPEALSEQTAQPTVIDVTANGPLLIYGSLTVRESTGEESHKTKVTAFCRCGHSAHKPYCDGSHIAASFQDS
ncbi:putative Fe-S cluster protein YjdI [Dyadobacter jejuensis]|uniref:Putative Fe-S cluster protein YjdI n=1 Tax=Dyadobacter jejuensis TaxID=1082580 RepID=A0A316AL46_9BACT|nr:(4Fe-4S)-binding protein [Dyadobacter jejuensis]PWJ58356.1 putative Fe-S cluster protein YjdI [Dyadobacter jejuensis]